VKWRGKLRFRPRTLVGWARRIPDGWNYAFQDVRLIVDRGGDVRHFYIPSWIQRRVVRSAYVMVGGLLGAVCISALANTYYWIGNTHLRDRNQQLVQTQEEVAKVLVESVGPTAALPANEAGAEQDLTGLATKIRQRSDALEDLSRTVTKDLVQLNRVLRVGLKDEGLPPVDTGRELGRGGKPVPAGATATPAATAGPGSLIAAIGDYTRLHGVYASLPAQLPISDFAVSSRFGDRTHPITGNADHHPGLDLVPMAGDRVLAVMAGTVERAGWEGGYGQSVIIRHSAHVQTRYGHLASIALKRGQKVAMGQSIGIAGSTGMSTGKHLHFEVLFDGRPVNPMPVVLINTVTSDLSTANVY